MKDIFIKAYWLEEDILYYMHFQDEDAVEQVEISPRGKVFLSLSNPVSSDSMLFDQAFSGLESDKYEFITKAEFDQVWNDR